MIEVGGVAFTAAIATVVALFYLVYSFLFKKSPPEDEPTSNGNHGNYFSFTFLKAMWNSILSNYEF